MKLTLTFLLGILIVAGQTKPKNEKYDPEKLAPNEIACGRSKGRAATPCNCMEARSKEHDEKIQACLLGPRGEVYKTCIKLTGALCDTKPVDLETSYKNWEAAMPVNCSRSCHTARCECCKT